MENLQLGQRRWKVVMTYGFWVKVAQLICALVAILLCVTFDEIAKVRNVKTSDYYSITLKFPFIYEANVTVHPPDGLPIRAFKFQNTLLPSVIAFVVVTALAMVVAIFFLVFKIIQHGSQVTQMFIKLNFFIVLGCTFLQLASVCFWMANLITLVQDVDDQLKFLLDMCRVNFVPCQTTTPKFPPLYVSMVFGISLFLLLSADCIEIFIRMVYTIPYQIRNNRFTRPTRPTSNVELQAVHGHTTGYGGL
ncbi:uncharacterized protein LOC114517566 [Dendronephthya gigantea]|uniref:uncharacterized protein LOC114517566 n=1 Tax=Dendronephthya gigantea TaxID=151771 RepID=UPI0010695BC4|nr:uncharacterized protein LOC114517566 [Dendronephthya gigantea]